MVSVDLSNPVELNQHEGRKPTPLAIEAPQVQAERPAVDKPLLGERVDDKGIRRSPAHQIRPGAHEPNDGVGAVIGGAENLLRDLGRYRQFLVSVCNAVYLYSPKALELTADADIVDDVLKISVARSVGDVTLRAGVDEAGRVGEARLCVAKVGSGRLGADRVDPELRRASVKLDGDDLARGAKGDLDRV